MINVVCAGKGIIRDELINKKIDKKILVYGLDLFVTWTTVPRLSLEGVEVFLYNKLTPGINHSTMDKKEIT